MLDLVEKGEDLILPCSDPAVTIVKGHRRYLLGLDIAQAAAGDKTAYSIILDEAVPEWCDRGQQLGKRRREIIKCDHILQMSYMDLALVVWNLVNDPALKGRCYLAVDSSGVGRSFCDTLDSKSVRHTRVTMTSGESENEVKERNTTFNNVGRNRLLSTLNSAIHTGDLAMGNFAMRDMLRQELESFEAEITKAGRMKIEGGTKFGHADVAISSALAYYLSDHRSVGAHIGEVPLKGYW